MTLSLHTRTGPHTRVWSLSSTLLLPTGGCPCSDISSHPEFHPPPNSGTSNLRLCASSDQDQVLGGCGFGKGVDGAGCYLGAGPGSASVDEGPSEGAPVGGERAGGRRGPSQGGQTASGGADSAGPAQAPAGGECERDAGRAPSPPSSGQRPTVRGVWESRKGRGVGLSRRSLEKGRCGDHSQPLAAGRRALGWSSVSMGWPTTPGRRCRCGWPSLRCGDAPLAGAPGARLRGGSPPASAHRPSPPWLHRLSPSAALSHVSPSPLTSFCRLSQSRPLVLSSLRPLCGLRGSFCVSLWSFSHLDL